MSSSQENIISELNKKIAYPHTVYRIRILETHISWILLTGLYAYKIKKEVKFGNILDFSNILLRKKFCLKEIALNRPHCGDIYQSVVKIVKENNSFRFVDLKEKGKPLEYAVKMIEIPQKFRMDNVVKVGRVNKKTINSLTEIIIKFHKNAPSNNKISRYGQPLTMRRKFDENFETLSKLGKIDSRIIEYKLISFLENNDALFYERIRESKIRDIHGDLYLKNIFLIDNKFYLYDRIEFNNSLRYADLVEDVAHLAMDLDFHERSDLSNHFISRYIKKSNDKNITSLIYFMMCYKACVRAKVSLFRAQEVNDKNEKIIHTDEAKKLLKLASKYIKLF